MYPTPLLHAWLNEKNRNNPKKPYIPYIPSNISFVYCWPIQPEIFLNPTQSPNTTINIQHIKECQADVDADDILLILRLFIFPRNNRRMEHPQYNWTTKCDYTTERVFPDHFHLKNLALNPTRQTHPHYTGCSFLTYYFGDNSEEPHTLLSLLNDLHLHMKKMPRINDVSHHLNLFYYSLDARERLLASITSSENSDQMLFENNASILALTNTMAKLLIPFVLFQVGQTETIYTSDTIQITHTRSNDYEIIQSSSLEPFYLQNSPPNDKIQSFMVIKTPTILSQPNLSYPDFLENGTEPIIRQLRSFYTNQNNLKKTLDTMKNHEFQQYMVETFYRTTVIEYLPSSLRSSAYREFLASQDIVDFFKFPTLPEIDSIIDRKIIEIFNDCENIVWYCNVGADDNQCELLALSLGYLYHYLMKYYYDVRFEYRPVKDAAHNTNKSEKNSSDNDDIPSHPDFVDNCDILVNNLTNTNTDDTDSPSITQQYDEKAKCSPYHQKWQQFGQSEHYAEYNTVTQQHTSHPSATPIPVDIIRSSNINEKLFSFTPNRVYHITILISNYHLDDNTSNRFMQRLNEIITFIRQVIPLITITQHILPNLPQFDENINDLSFSEPPISPPFGQQFEMTGGYHDFYSIYSPFIKNLMDIINEAVDRANISHSLQYHHYNYKNIPNTLSGCKEDLHFPNCCEII